MRPEYIKGDFASGEIEDGEYVTLPAKYANEVEWGEDGHEIESGWFVRLAAPGYLASTEWDGPFKTKKEAMDHIENIWDMDPETGDALDDA
jgi:hypothetical protein